MVPVLAFRNPYPRVSRTYACTSDFWVWDGGGDCVQGLRITSMVFGLVRRYEPNLLLTKYNGEYRSHRSQYPSALTPNHRTGQASQGAQADSIRTARCIPSSIQHASTSPSPTGRCKYLIARVERRPENLPIDKEYGDSNRCHAEGDVEPRVLRRSSVTINKDIGEEKAYDISCSCPLIVSLFVHYRILFIAVVHLVQVHSLGSHLPRQHRPALGTATNPSLAAV